MDAFQLARSLADGGRVNQIGARSDQTHTFRVLSSAGVYVLKIYDAESYARREERSFSVLAAAGGTPQIIERGDTEGTHWVKFADPGAWTMSTLPENLDAARRCGEIIRSVHTLDPENATNLAGGLTEAKVAADFHSIFQRLGRFRGRLNMSAEALATAAAVPEPRSSKPIFSHTNPEASNFFVDEGGEVTLFDWTWSTLAPPEWDFSFAYWSLASVVSPRAANAFTEGYGASLTDDDLRPWIVYHIGAFLLREAENLSGRLEHLKPQVDLLQAYATI